MKVQCDACGWANEVDMCDIELDVRFYRTARPGACAACGKTGTRFPLPYNVARDVVCREPNGTDTLERRLARKLLLWEQKTGRRAPRVLSGTVTFPMFEAMRRAMEPVAVVAAEPNPLFNIIANPDIPEDEIWFIGGDAQVLPPAGGEPER